jgi:hypothetical protein
MVSKLVAEFILRALALFLTTAIPEPAAPVRDLTLAEQFAMHRRQGWSDAEIEIGIGGQ